VNSKLVSILTPSFNQACWLADNLRSVANQTHPHIEHIVMDGGSTDGSVDILRGQAGPHVRWVSEPDRGQSHALNKGFAESRGGIIGWLNSDDAYFTPTAVAEAVQLFERCPDVDVVYGHAALVNADGLILQMIWVPPFSYRLFRYHNFISQPAAFIRRYALEARIADEAYDYSMDRELWLRLGRHHRFVRLDKVLAVDRHHLARKAYTRPDLARADVDRLVATYGVPQPRGWWVQAQGKVVKVTFRLMGVRLLPQASGPFAFQGIQDSYWRLALRQVAVRRAAMPVGSISMQSLELLK
jgi:glycosyltransferase involved in cell wall biosynthesis